MSRCPTGRRAPVSSAPAHPPLRVYLLGAVVWLASCGDPKAPVACAEIPQQTINVGVDVDLTPCFEDPENETITLTVESSNPQVATASVSGSGIRVRGVFPGSAEVTVTATDPDMLTAELSFEVIVPNRPPVARGAMPDTAVIVGGRAQWVASEYFEEPDGQELTYTAVSSDAGVAEVSVAAETVVATGRSLGSATITVTATDPGGLEATQEATVAVVEFLTLFRDDFETDESLDNWEDYNGSRFWISDEKLMIENTDSFSPAFVGMELATEDWEVRASMANGTSRSWVQVGIGAYDDPVEAYLFQLGEDPDTLWGAPETNYRLLVGYEGEEEFVLLEGAYGYSDVVQDLNEPMEMRLSVHGGTLAISVDGTELFSTDLGAQLSNAMEDMVLGVWNTEGTAGRLGVFDWVEVLQGPPQGPGDLERGVTASRPFAASLRHLPDWLSKVEIGGTVRVEDGRLVRSEWAPGSWRRR